MEAGVQRKGKGGLFYEAETFIIYHCVYDDVYHDPGFFFWGGTNVVGFAGGDVLLDGAVLIDGTDYSLSYKNNRKVRTFKTVSERQYYSEWNAVRTAPPKKVTARALLKPLSRLSAVKVEKATKKWKKRGYEVSAYYEYKAHGYQDHEKMYG